MYIDIIFTHKAFIPTHKNGRVIVLITHKITFTGSPLRNGVFTDLH